MKTIHNRPKNEQLKLALLSLKSQLDMDAVPFLSNFDRRQVCVPKSCSSACILYGACRYHHYLKRAQSSDIFIQICNHNYLLADAAHRLQGLRPLLKDYQALVIDEAHKLPDAAKQINEQHFSLEEAENLCVLLAREGFPTLARKLREKFARLLSLFSSDFTCCKIAFMPTTEQTAALHDCLNLFRQAEKVHPWLPNQTVFLLDETEQLLRTFLRPDQRYILYVEYDTAGRPALCAADREPAVQLKKNLWAQEIPTILTSGTLAVGGCFDHIEKILGLSNQKQTYFTAPSPFPYQSNCLLYIPENAARRMIGTKKEALYLASQIQQLIEATHGHTLVLFTSYALMNVVYRQLNDSVLFPILVVQNIAWVCKDCGQQIGSFHRLLLKKTIEKQFLELCSSPELAVPVQTAVQPLSLKAAKMEGEIRQLLNQRQVDAERVLQLIKACTTEKYQTCDVGAFDYRTANLLQLLKSRQPIETFDVQLFEQVVEKVILTGTGTVQFRLCNQKIL